MNKRAAGLALGGAVVIAAVALWLWPRPVIWACGARSGSDLLPNDNGSAYAVDKTILNPKTLAPPDTRMPRGGRYIYPGQASNIRKDDDVILRVTQYDAACDSIVIGGQPLGGTNLPDGYTVYDGKNNNGTSMVLTYGEGDRTIILRGVPMGYWAAGAAQQKHGTAAPDMMVGDSSDEVFVPGSGPDTVAPAGGNDRVVYSFGDLTILATPPNSGHDTLNLSRYTLEKIAFAVEGEDLVLKVADGTIILKQQLSMPDGNIETLLLADKNAFEMQDIQSLLTERAAN